MSKRTPTSLLIVLSLAAGCQPASLIPALPGPVPGGMAGPAAPQPAPVLPAKGEAVTTMAARIVFPAGSYLKLRAGLRTQAAVRPEEITVEDLAALNFQLNGRPLTRDQVRVSTLTWDDKGQLVATFSLVNLPPTTTATLQIANATGSVTMLATVDATARSEIQVDVRSTARSLLLQEMAAKGETVVPEAIDERAVTLVANQLSHLIVTSSQAAILQNTGIRALVTATATAIVDSPAATLSSELAQIERSHTASGGGGGGSSFNPQSPPPNNGSYLASIPTPFGIASVWDLAQVGSTIFATANGRGLLWSQDDGVTWTDATSAVGIAKRLLAVGNTLYGCGPGSGDLWQWTTSGTKTSISATGLPAGIDCRGLAFHGNTLYLAAGDGLVYYKDLTANGNWLQYGSGGWTAGKRIFDLLTDGTALYASVEGGVYRIALGNPALTWTSLSGGTAPNTGKQFGRLTRDGSTLYLAHTDGVYAYASGAWSQEVVAAGFDAQHVWTGNGELHASGRVSKSFSTDGQTLTGYETRIYTRPLGGGSWTQLGDSIQQAEVNGPDAGAGLVTPSGAVLSFSCRKTTASASWQRVMSEYADFQGRLGLSAAGGALWACHYNQLWRGDPVAGQWQPWDNGLPAGWIYPPYRTPPLHAVGDKVFLALGRTLYVLDASQNSASWTALADKPGNTGEVYALTSDSSFLYALLNSGQVYKAPVAGGTWDPVGPLYASGFYNVSKFAVSGDTLYAADHQNVYFCQATDASWGQTSALPVYISSLLATPARLIISGHSKSGGPAIQQWDGSNWAPMAGITAIGATGMAALDDGYYAATDNGIYKLPLGEAAWSQVQAISYNNLANLVYEPTTQKFFGSTTGKGLARTP